MSLAEILTGLACLILLLGALVWTIVVLWFVHVRMDELLGYLANSRGVRSRGCSSKGGFRRRMMSFSDVGMLVTFSHYYIKVGELTNEDLRGLPKPLKRQLVTLHILGLVMLLIAVAVGVVIMLWDLSSYLAAL